MTHDLITAHNVLYSMASGFTAREAAEKHGVTLGWAEKLVNEPPRWLLDADWYRPLRQRVREARAKRFGKVIRVSNGGRRV